MELLERDQALDDLRRLLGQAAGGRGCLLFVDGEAGVGKTSLLRRFMDESRGQARVLLGQCDALSTPRALGPLHDFAEPALSRLLIEDGPRDLIFQTLLSRFSTSNRATLFIIEDAHWADEATLDLLRFLGRRIAAARVLMVATYRSDEVGSRHPLQRLLGDLATVAEVARLTLAPLTFDAVSALAGARELDAVDLHARTGGNPFFVAEVLAASGAIPPNVRDAVLARASRLPPSAWALLEAATIIGSPIDPAVLAAVARPDPGDLERCLDGGMLVTTGQLLAFRHELAREAMLTTIHPARRMELHREILKILEEGPAELHDSARLAHHAEGAGDASAVLRHAPEAARKAARLRAHREEAEQYARALRFAAGLPPAERARLLEARAHACYLTAQIDQAITARTAALELWASLGDLRREGVNRCALALLLWAQTAMDVAEREARTAVAMLETLPPGGELAMAYATLARLRGTTLDDDEALSWGEQAITLAEQVDATETLADALITVGVARMTRGDISRGQQQLERSIQLSLAAGLDDLTARAHANLGFGYDEHFRFGLAAEHFARGMQFCAERDLDNSRQHMTAWFARCQLFLGNWDEATSLSSSLLQARDLAPVTRFVALLVEGVVRTRRGDPSARPLLDQALELAVESGSLYRIGPIRAARAEAAWLAGDRPRCAAEARAAFPLAAERAHPWYLGELAFWRHRAGDPPAPLPASAIAPPFAALLAADWPAAAAAWDALACPYEAARARAEGDDPHEVRAALAVFERLAARPAAAAARRRLRALGVVAVPRGPRPSTRANPAGLTARELDVLRLLADGRPSAAIAAHLFLSARTVDNHVAALLAKLAAPSRADAVQAARRLGLLPQSE